MTHLIYYDADIINIYAYVISLLVAYYPRQRRSFIKAYFNITFWHGKLAHAHDVRSSGRCFNNSRYLFHESFERLMSFHFERISLTAFAQLGMAAPRMPRLISGIASEACLISPSNTARLQ